MFIFFLVTETAIWEYKQRETFNENLSGMPNLVFLGILSEDFIS